MLLGSSVTIYIFLLAENVKGFFKLFTCTYNFMNNIPILWLLLDSINDLLFSKETNHVEGDPSAFKFFIGKTNFNCYVVCIKN